MSSNPVARVERDHLSGRMSAKKSDKVLGAHVIREAGREYSRQQRRRKRPQSAAYAMWLWSKPPSRSNGSSRHWKAIVQSVSWLSPAHAHTHASVRPVISLPRTSPQRPGYLSGPVSRLHQHAFGRSLHVRFCRVAPVPFVGATCIPECMKRTRPA